MAYLARPAADLRFGSPHCRLNWRKAKVNQAFYGIVDTSTSKVFIFPGANADGLMFLDDLPDSFNPANGVDPMFAKWSGLPANMKEGVNVPAMGAAAGDGFRGHLRCVDLAGCTRVDCIGFRIIKIAEGGLIKDHSNSLNGDVTHNAADIAEFGTGFMKHINNAWRESLKAFLVRELNFNNDPEWCHQFGGCPMWTLNANVGA